MNVLERIKKEELELRLIPSDGYWNNAWDKVDCHADLLKLAETGKRMQWITFKKGGYPDKYENVLVYDEKCGVHECEFRYSIINDEMVTEWWIDKIDKLYNVTHWMNMPLAPKATP